MTHNPWPGLRTSAPFVLTADRDRVEMFNGRAGRARYLHVDKLLPEPFIGNPLAPVLLLSNNPGVGGSWESRATPAFQRRIRKNLSHQPHEYPFYYLDPKVQGPNREWWERRVKYLIQEFGLQTVSKSILNVVFFPYPSHRFSHDRLAWDSREYGFHLVREAIKRRAFIVFMRRSRCWLDAIPELGRYDLKCQVNNTMNPTVSPTNLCDFKKVVATIAASLDRRR